MKKIIFICISAFILISCEDPRPVYAWDSQLQYEIFKQVIDDEWADQWLREIVDEFLSNDLVKEEEEDFATVSLFKYAAEHFTILGLTNEEIRENFNMGLDDILDTSDKYFSSLSGVFSGNIFAELACEKAPIRTKKMFDKLIDKLLIHLERKGENEIELVWWNYIDPYANANLFEKTIACVKNWINKNEYDSIHKFEVAYQIGKDLFVLVKIVETNDDTYPKVSIIKKGTTLNEIKN